MRNQYEKQEKDIYDFISQDKELDQFFRKALLVSSPTLYKNYINKPTDKKKYEKLKESLLKYFLVELLNEYIILGTTEAMITSSISLTSIFDAFKKLSSIKPYSSEVLSNLVVKR